MKNTTNNPFENFLSVCRMHAQAGRISADIPLMYLHGDDPDDCYAIYQEWDETDNPTVWDARLKVTPADVAAEDLMKPWIDIIEMPPMKLKDMPESVMGTSVLARIKSLRKRRDGLAAMEAERTEKFAESFAGDGDSAPTPCLILSGCHAFGTEAFSLEVGIRPDHAENVAVVIPMGMRWNHAIANLQKVLSDFEFMVNGRFDTTVEALELPNSDFSRV